MERITQLALDHKQLFLKWCDEVEFVERDKLEDEMFKVIDEITRLRTLGIQGLENEDKIGQTRCPIQ